MLQGDLASEQKQSEMQVLSKERREAVTEITQANGR